MEAVGPLADWIGQDCGDQGHRSEQQGRLGGGHPAHELGIEHEREAQRGDRQAHRGDGDIGEAEVAILEQAQWQEWLEWVAGLPHQEDSQQEQAEDDQSPDRDRASDGAPVVLVALLDAEDQTKQASARQHYAEPVELVWMSAQVGHQAHGQHESDHANWHIDEEDPFPAHAVDEHPTQDGPDESGHTCGGAPQGHGATASLGREDPGDDRHCLRGHHRSAEALGDSGQDQHLDGLGEAAPQ